MKKRGTTGLWILLAVGAAAAMTWLSGQSGTDSAAASERVLRALLTLLPGEPAAPLRDETIHLFRKAAHFILFFLLGCAAAGALRRQEKLPVFWASVALCAVFGALDEAHQIFIPDRTPRALDVLLDTGGAAVGSAVFLWLSGYWRRRK